MIPLPKHASREEPFPKPSSVPSVVGLRYRTFGAVKGQSTLQKMKSLRQKGWFSTPYPKRQKALLVLKRCIKNTKKERKKAQNR